MHREARELLLGQLQADRHRVERAPRHDRAPGPRHVVRGQQPERHQARQRVVEVRRLLARQFQLVGRAVQRQRLAVAVEDQAAGGGIGSMRMRLPCDSSLK